MDPVSPISGYAAALPPARVGALPVAGALSASAGTPGTAGLASPAAASSQLTASASMLSVHQSSELLVVPSDVGTAAVSNELLGAVLLMLLLEYLKSSGKEDDQKNLLVLMAVVAQMMQAEKTKNSPIVYSASSLSVESTSVQIAASGTNLGSTYTPGGIQPSPATEPGAAGLDVVA